MKRYPARRSLSRNVRIVLCPSVFLVCFAFCLLVSFPVKAAFQDTFAGARALGIGGAYVAIADDTDSLAVNPAGLGRNTSERRQEVTASYGGLYLGLTEGAQFAQSFVAYTIAEQSFGGAGLAWKHSDAGGLYTEERVAVGVARRFGRGENKRLSFGGKLELLRWDAAPTFDANGRVLEDLSGPVKADISVGAQFTLSDNVPIGVAFQHLNRPNVAVVGVERLPVQTLFGIGVRGERTLWAFDIQLERDDVDVRTGLEWEAHPEILFLRAGFRLEGLALGTNATLGAGLYLSSATALDYAAWIPVGGIQETWGSHRVSLSYTF